MDSEKKAIPSIYNIPQPEPICIQESQKPASKSNKRYVIGAVVVVLVLLITVGAVLGALKLSNEFARDTIKEYRIGAKTVVKVDKDNEMTEFEDPQEGYSAYNDFQKGLTMMKVVVGESYVCYLNPLSSEALTLETMDSYMKHHPDGGNLTSHDQDADLPKYMPARETISDRRFLSSHLREACEGYPIHWLIPASDITSTEGESTHDVVGRHKRHTIYQCCYICQFCSMPTYIRCRGGYPQLY